ncbi:hypothetical protein DFH11DRAFT_1548747 [Phellopilus nigrolimitatus]|nr:hypothetical protein DFH11DRAFT_1548747 [Phellopilus nigrolimitatus]
MSIPHQVKFGQNIITLPAEMRFIPPDLATSQVMRCKPRASISLQRDGNAEVEVTVKKHARVGKRLLYQAKKLTRSVDESCTPRVDIWDVFAVGGFVRRRREDLELFAVETDSPYPRSVNCEVGFFILRNEEEMHHSARNITIELLHEKTNWIPEMFSQTACQVNTLDPEVGADLREA